MASDWRVGVLKGMGAPVTKKNLKFLTNWQRWEGGHTNNSATFNWLNTTSGKQYPAINSVGVRAFPDEGTGIAKTVETLNNGRYPNLVRGLLEGNPYQPSVASDLSTWLSGSPTSASGAKYASKVLGGNYRPTRGPSRPTIKQPGRASNVPDAKRQHAQELINLAMGFAREGRISPEQAVGFLGSTRELAQQSRLVSPKGNLTPPSPRQGVTGSVVDRVLAAAHTQVGKPYVFGSGPDTSSFDCSDLVQWAYKQVGVEIPRVAADQMGSLPQVGWKNIQPGDLIFRNDGGHVVMYVGGGKVIAAPHTGTVVQYQPVSRFSKDGYNVRRVM